MDPIAYAMQSLADLALGNPEEADKRFKKWMRYFDDEGITSISEGFVILRKTAGSAPWFITEELARDLTADRVEAISDLFDAQDWLEDHENADQLLAVRFQLPDSVQPQTAFRSDGQKWVEDGVVLYKAGGLHANIHPRPGSSCNSRM